MWGEVSPPKPHRRLIRSRQPSAVGKEAHVETVTSGDGTRIAFERLGRGPALVIVGASLADHRFYAPLANELANHLKV